MITKKRKYVTIMGIGVVMNFVLYNLAHFGHLPVWLDTIGTSYVAMMLEPAAGLLVGYVHNFYEAVAIYGPSSILYYGTSAVAAVATGVLIRKNGRIQMKRLPLAVGVQVVVNTVISASLTIARTGGIPDSGWERMFQQTMMEGGMSLHVSCYLAALILKVFDGIVLVIALYGLYKVTPERWYQVQHDERE